MWISYTSYPFERPEVLTRQQYVNLKSNPELFKAGLTAMDEYTLNKEYGLKAYRGVLCLLWALGFVIFIGFIILGMSGWLKNPFFYLLPLSPILIIIRHSAKMSKMSLKARLKKTRKFAEKLIQIEASTNDYEEFCEEYRELGRIRLFSFIPVR